MKKILFILSIGAVGLAFLPLRSDAVQQDVATDSSSVLVLQSSWTPNSSVQLPFFTPKKNNQLQFGGAVEVQATEEIVSAASRECLACHAGTYSSLAAFTADNVDRNGEVVNPHIYVDANRGMSQDNNAHNGRLIVPDCTRCHFNGKAHTLPQPTDVESAIVTRLNFCYSCHHEETWESCSSCH